ncbi:hypothetical protein KY290_013571 [Solanum tuberosum]|uniref:Uncharacterized protein n=1 Tax=Solanum tuberosum TaxID=4113 RepID=A0ABQ7VP67_SOLTU|nr:hypothetical protein KY289_013696 [Solanum tuberosum]KAH0717012.1 hypothetical protein KY285_013043 [Solanum tuberosum]KAH0769590.1 hypothetical protein KY290_013571 [Solanum tuberosum]
MSIDDWAGNCYLMILGLYAIDRGLYGYRKYWKKQNVKKEQNVKLKVLREINQQCEDRILAERESCFPLHPYMYSTPLSGTSLEEEEKGA